MPNLVESFQKIAVDAVTTMKPTEICYGTVQAIAPLQIGLSQKLVLGGINFDVGQRLAKHLAVHPLQVGDILILFRFQGGQRYLIYDKKGEL